MQLDAIEMEFVPDTDRLANMKKMKTVKALQNSKRADIIDEVIDRSERRSNCMMILHLFVSAQCSVLRNRSK